MGNNNHVMSFSQNQSPIILLSAIFVLITQKRKNYEPNTLYKEAPPRNTDANP